MITNRREFMAAAVAFPIARGRFTRALFYDYRLRGQASPELSNLDRLRSLVDKAALYEDRRDLTPDSGVRPGAGCYLYSSRGTMHVDASGNWTFYPARPQ